MSDRSIELFIAAAKTECAKLEKRIVALRDCRVTAMTDSDGELAQAVAAAAPDIVVIDTRFCRKHWPTALFDIKQRTPNPGVVVLDKSADKSNLLSAFRDGADAYISGNPHPEVLVAALTAAEKGFCFFARTDVDELRDHMRFLELGSARNVARVKDGIASLTVREKEVFPLLADGKSIKEVALILGISPKTVETHKYSIKRKLNFETMADFTKMALIKDLIPI